MTHCGNNVCQLSQALLVFVQQTTTILRHRTYEMKSLEPSKVELILDLDCEVNQKNV